MTAVHARVRTGVSAVDENSTCYKRRPKFGLIHLSVVKGHVEVCSPPPCDTAVPFFKMPRVLGALSSRAVNHSVNTCQNN